MCASMCAFLCWCVYELNSALCMDGNESGVEGGGEERYT